MPEQEQMKPSASEAAVGAEQLVAEWIKKELFLCYWLPGNKVLFGDKNIFPFMVQV